MPMRVIIWQGTSQMTPSMELFVRKRTSIRPVQKIICAFAMEISPRWSATRSPSRAMACVATGDVGWAGASLYGAPDGEGVGAESIVAGCLAEAAVSFETCT